MREHLRDQFEEYKKLNFKPQYICILAGSNDADDWDTFANEFLHQNKDKEHIKTIIMEHMNRWLKEIQEKEINSLASCLSKYHHLASNTFPCCHQHSGQIMVT